MGVRKRISASAHSGKPKLLLNSQQVTGISSPSNGNGVKIGGRSKAVSFTVDIVEVSSTKRRDCGTVNLDGGWKLFNFEVDSSVSALPSPMVDKMMTIFLYVRLAHFNVLTSNSELESIPVE